MPACHEVVYELKCVISDCKQQLKKPDLTERMKKNLREVVQKIELSIELLEAAKRERESPG